MGKFILACPNGMYSLFPHPSFFLFSAVPYTLSGFHTVIAYFTEISNCTVKHTLKYDTNVLPKPFCFSFKLCFLF